jgi:hypothetical protein
MSDAPPIDAAPIDEALSGLSELAACDLRLAKRFAARIEACGDEADGKAMDLARSYQRMARSYRQTLIVQARLRRELKAEARQDAGEAKVARRERAQALKDHIHAEVSPRVWRMEREAEDCEALDGLLADLVDHAAARADFLDLAPEAHVAAMLAELGLDAAPVAPPQGELSAKLAEGDSSPAAEAPSTAVVAPVPGGEGPDDVAPPLFNGRLAPPMDLPPWADEDSS